MLRLIQDDNRRIRDELSELQEKRGKEHQRLKFERENAASSQELTDTDLAPGLTLDQAIDLKRKSRCQGYAIANFVPCSYGLLSFALSLARFRIVDIDIVYIDCITDSYNRMGSNSFHHITLSAISSSRSSDVFLLIH